MRIICVLLLAIPVNSFANTFYVSWDPNTEQGVTYELSCKVNSNPESVCASGLIDTTTQLTSSALGMTQPTDNLCVRLRAHNSDGYSPYSDSVCIDNSDTGTTEKRFSVNISFVVDDQINGVDTRKITLMAITDPVQSLTGSDADIPTSVYLAGNYIHWGSVTTGPLDSYTMIGSYQPESFSPAGNRPIYNFDGKSNRDGVLIKGAGNGFELHFPAANTEQTAIIYLGGWSAGGTVTAGDYSVSFENQTGVYDKMVTIKYQGQELIVQYVMDNSYDPNGNITLQAAELK